MEWAHDFDIWGVFGKVEKGLQSRREWKATADTLV